MTTSPAWFEGLAPVVVWLPVDRDVHRIEWHDGALHLDAHGDPDAEAALAALGGGRCPCLDVLDAWNAQSDEPEILTIGHRHLAEAVNADRRTLARLEREAGRWRSQWSAATEDLRVGGNGPGAAQLQRVAESAERRLRVRLGFVRVLSLDPALQHRLQLTVLAGAESRWSDAAFRARHGARLQAALAGRARPALLAAGYDVDLSAIEVRDPGAAPLVTAGRVALPLSWLTNVWGRGVGAVDGRFVSEVVAVEEAGKVLVLRGVDGNDWRFRRPPEDHR